MWNVFGGKKRSKHHIIPKSREADGYNVHQKSNLVSVNDSFHVGLHQCFGNATPKEQFSLLGMISKKVMSRKAQRILDKLSNMKDEEFYDNEFVSRR